MYLFLLFFLFYFFFFSVSGVVFQSVYTTPDGLGSLEQAPKSKLQRRWIGSFLRATQRRWIGSKEGGFLRASSKEVGGGLAPSLEQAPKKVDSLEQAPKKVGWYLP